MQDSAPAPDKTAPNQAAPAKPPSDARPLSKKEQQQRDQALQKELKGPFQKWLDEDVTYIITPEERLAFRRLHNDEEREQFVEQFWMRRNPNSDSAENDYKDEHYRRMAYANEHFASGIPGWKTDRGRIYIMHGPPDDREYHEGQYQRHPQEGGGTTSTYPFEVWRYHYIEGAGQNIEIEFVDKTMTGEYHMAIDPSEKDALLHVPKVGLTALEEAGMASKGGRFGRFDGTQMGNPTTGQPDQTREFERLRTYANLNKPPELKFKDLQEVVNSRISYNLFPFQARTDFLKITSETVLSTITLQLKVKDMGFTKKEAIQQATVNIFGQVTNLTGRVVQRFEDVVQVDVPADELSKYLEQSRVYWKALPLRPGLYKLNLVVKDTRSGNMGTQSIGLRVPRYADEGLAASTLILADLIEKVPTRQIGKGEFVIGSTKVRPAVDQRFSRDQSLGVYLQVYNLATDEKSHKPQATVEYSVLKGDKTLAHWTERGDQLNATGQQLTLEKMMTLKQLAPGSYRFEVKITDEIAKQTITPSATFRVE